MKTMVQLLLVMMAMTIANLTLAAADRSEVSRVLRKPIETEFMFKGRPVRLILPENFDKGNDLIPLILHLHGAVPFPNVPDLELDNSGYRGLPGKYRVMVAAPRGTLHPNIGVYFWGIHVRRDTWVSVRYAEALNSAKSSVTLQSTDRHGILGQKPTYFQVSL